MVSKLDINTDAEKFRKFYDSRMGKKILRAEAAYLSREFAGLKKILDLGCGIGSFELLLRDFDVIALDISQEMLREAKLSRVPNLVRGDAEYLCFKNAVFDGAFAVTTLEFLSHPENTIKEVARVLAPKGRFIGMMLNPRSEYFQKHYSRAGSYFRKIKHHPDEIESINQKFFHTTREYFLGIAEEDVFHTTDERKAALYVVKGTKK